MSKQPTEPAPPKISRLERVLGAMVITTIGLSILCFLATILGSGIAHIDPTSGIWPMIIALPVIGLPIGFVLIIVLVVVNMRARSREAQGGSR